MRLTDQQVQQICQIVAALVGTEAELILPPNEFGEFLRSPQSNS